jgi:hypothetical protein
LSSVKLSANYQLCSMKGQANGYAGLGSDGKVPAAQLPASSGGSAWGGITGTLSDQTDLQTALNGKAASGHNHDASYAAVGHNHNAAYSAIGHNHDANYATAAHNHDGVYSLVGHTHAGGADPFLAKLKLAADVTNATTTPAVVTGLAFDFEANSTYVVELFALCTSAAATTGYGFALDTSVAVNGVGFFFVHQLANAGTVTGGSSLADNTATGVSSGVPAITVANPVIGSGILISGATPGNAQLRFRPEVAASATCKAGTVLRVMKV